MSQADHNFKSIPLSRLAKSPVLRTFFERGEKGNSKSFAVPAPKKPVLAGGAAVRIREFA